MRIPPILIEIEASDFGKESYPIEIGYVDNRGQPWCSLITPCDDWTHWNPVAENLHHISREILLAHGKSIDVIVAHLNKAFLNKTVYSDSWLQDFTWLSQLFEVASIPPHFKLEDLRAKLTPYQESIWHETKQSILNEFQVRRHRASADAKVLQLTWLKTAESEALVGV
jgi:hypothetical protein